MSFPDDRDLFDEEQEMVTMSFGDHLEELRSRMILGLLGLAVGVVFTFLPPLNLGRTVALMIQRPAEEALESFDIERTARKADEGGDLLLEEPIVGGIRISDIRRFVGSAYPDLLPEEPESDPAKMTDSTERSADPRVEAGLLVDSEEDPLVTIPIYLSRGNFTRQVGEVSAGSRNGIITTGPLEAAIIYFTVCIITGLVLSSPWVFYQAWAFIAAGLYRHERKYVYRFFPVSLGLFLAGVSLCFFFVLPTMLKFLLFFNTYIGAEPFFRVKEWMGFATFLPLVFGVCFQTPIVMLFLERIGVFTVESYRSKRRYAILIIFIVAALITPSPDGFSQLMLAVPMILLYELGILLVQSSVLVPHSTLHA